MKLKDLMKLNGLKATELAEQLGLEYGALSTVLAMDERGETPKRPSVRQRTEYVREHLEKLQQIADRSVIDVEDPRRRKEVWDDELEAARRFPVAPGATQRFEHDRFKLGARVRLTLDPSGPATYRFLRVVEREGREPYADVIAMSNGAMRSVRLSELQTGERSLTK